jgi:hypothetical protein
MPYKDLEVRKRKHKKYSREHYLANKVARQAKLRARRKELKAEWDEYKASLICIKCGFSHPAALDFHHRDAKNKESIVSKLIGDGCFTRAKKEAAKCDVLCANCHRIHHYEEKLLASKPQPVVPKNIDGEIKPTNLFIPQVSS